MSTDQEKFEKQERARRLREARQAAGISGPKGVVERSRNTIKEDTYKGHEQGRNGFTVSDAKIYAKLFDVSLAWLYLGIGERNYSDAANVAPLRTVTEIHDFLRRIEGLRSHDIAMLMSVIRNAIVANQASQGHSAPSDQSQSASSPHESAPSRSRS